MYSSQQGHGPVNRSCRGNAILITAIFVTIIVLLAGLIFKITNYNNLMAMRNDELMKARAVAESELERLYYEFVTLRLNGIATSKITEQASMIALADIASSPSTVRTPFLAAHQANYSVMRSIIYERQNKGLIPNTTNCIGTFNYLTTRVVVTNLNSNLKVEVRLGRRLISASSVIFQNAILYQGDLDLNPTSNYEVKGDIVCNGNIYMSSTASGVLTIDAKVSYGHGCYFDTNANGDVLYRNPNGYPSGNKAGDTAPTYGTSATSQVSELEQSQNLLSGLDADEIQARRTDLFDTTNDVYRAIICPKPDTNSTEYPNYNSTLGDDPAIAGLRTYNKASVIFTVDAGGSISVTKVASDGTTSSTNAFNSAIVGGATTTTLYDFRENHYVRVLTLDLSILHTLLNINGVFTDFNGVIYVNQIGWSSSMPAAVKLINGTTLPHATLTNTTGFNLTTNGGIYVVGDYNTDETVSTTSALMGDSLTFLSSNWPSSDYTKYQLIEDPTYLSGLGYDMTRYSGLNRMARTFNSGAHVGDTMSMTFRSGVMTGNVPGSGTAYSGGAQNLIRFMEGWQGITDTANPSNSIPSGAIVTKGSVSCTFASKIYTGSFHSPSVPPAVYTIPNRSIVFDTTLRDNPPTGSPETTLFSRGTLFTW